MMFCDIWLLTSYDERKCYSLKLVPSFLNVCLTSNIFLGALNYLILNTNSRSSLQIVTTSTLAAGPWRQSPRWTSGSTPAAPSTCPCVGTTLQCWSPVRPTLKPESYPLPTISAVYLLLAVQYTFLTLSQFSHYPDHRERTAELKYLPRNSLPAISPLTSFVFSL